MQDPLNVSIPLTGVETDLPLAPESEYPLQVTASTIDPNKDKTGLNWNLELSTTDVITAVDGRQIKPNFKFFHTVGLQPGKDSKDPEGFLRPLGETIDAVFNTTKENRGDFNRDRAASAVGKTVLGQVYIDEWQGQKRNKIRRLKKLA